MLDQVGRTNKASIIGLDQGERFVIWGIRRIVTEGGPDGAVLDESFKIFDEDGAAGSKILAVFLRFLGRAARRIFDIGSPDTLFLTWDEHCILSLLGAAQTAGEICNPDLLDAHLRWLAKPEQRAELGLAVTALARLLALHGHRISLGAAARPEQCDDAGFMQAEGLSLVPQAILAARRYPAFTG